MYLCSSLGIYFQIIYGQVKRYMIVITNERTKDPDVIHRARELIRLLSKTNVSPSMVRTIHTCILNFLSFILSTY